MAVTRQTAPWTELLNEGRDDGRLVREAFEGARAPQLVDVPDGLHPRVYAALEHAGVEQLYSHQHEALMHALTQTTIVTTGTASGKSLSFQLPTLHALLSRPQARALYLYPTKALAQDQARALHRFGLTKELRPAIYDGDTRQEDRRAVRQRSNLILTNPDMLHMGILPNHHKWWADFFHNLDIVVIDEAHVYRGVFGSHMANVIRRLRRVCAGHEPRILLASATVANPGELAERLTGLDDVHVVSEDGSAGARRQIAMWNPPLTDETLQTRGSALGEAGRLMARLISEGSRTICFLKSRKGVELISRIVKDELAQLGVPELADRVSPYRAGYTAQQRRELEAKLTDGSLLGVVTTDALELGIDIGALDAAICVTFPGTVASLRQMWGRAGRRGRGLAVYVAGEDALDQYFCRHPDEFLERAVEAAILDHESEEIHAQHLLCAAHEAPIDPVRDADTLGPRVRAHCEHLAASGELVERQGRFVLRRPEQFPAADTSLRSASRESFSIVDIANGEVLGTVEGARAHSTVHQGAVYLHIGRRYEVQALHLEEQRALVTPFDGPHYTQPKRASDTFIEKLLDRREAHGVSLNFGVVTVTEQVQGYQLKRLADHEVMGLETLDLPPTSFTTRALWYELDSELLREDFPGEVLLGALHATEHAQIAVLPLIAMCDRWDIGGLSTNLHPQTGGPAIFIYDGHPGGVGITRQGYREFTRLCEDAHRLIGECGCSYGCPSCVQSPKCGNLNDHLHKAGALELLTRMLAVA